MLVKQLKMVGLTTSSSESCRAGNQTNSININMEKRKIIRISELLEEKLEKQKELSFYEEELQRLFFKMSIVKQEIQVTETIIKLIENEEIPNLLKDFEP